VTVRAGSLRRWLAGGGLALALGALLLLYHDVDLNLADEGIPLAQTLALERDAVTGASAAPLLHRNLATLELWAFHLGGRTDVRSARLLWLGVRVLLGLTLFALATRLLPLPLALLVGALAALIAGPWHKSWYALGLGLTLAAVGGGDPARRWLRLALVGLLAGVLFSLYPPGLGPAAVAPAVAWLLLEPFLLHEPRALRRSVTALLVLPPLAIAGAILLAATNGLALIALRGAPAATLLAAPRAVLGSISLEGVRLLLGAAGGYASQARLPLSSLFEPGALGWVPGLVFLLQPAVIVAAALLARARAHAGEPRAAILIGFTAALAAASFGKTLLRPDLFHVTQGSAPGALLMLLLLWRGALGLRGRWSSLRLPVRAAGALGLAFAAALFPVGTSAAVLSSPAQWAAGPGSLALAGRRLQLPRGGVRLPAGRAETLEQLVARVRAWSGEADPIFALPFCPALYFLAGRRCAVEDARFPYGLLVLTPGLGLHRGDVDGHLAGELERQGVKVVVRCPELDPRLPAWPRLPRTRALLEERYQAAWSQGGFVILRRR